VILALIELVIVVPTQGQDSLNWVRTGGPPGGLGYDVRMHPENPDVMFVTDAHAGVFRSFDTGHTWVPSNNGITARAGRSGDEISIFCVTIDQNNPNVVWAGLAELRGIYKSTDMGETWSEMVNGIVENVGITFRGFTVDPRSSDIVYAAGEIASFAWSSEPQPGREFDKTKGVIYKTTDGGQNWNAIWRGDNLARYVWIHPRNPDTLYVSTGIFDREAANSDHMTNTPGGVGILKSIDGGQNWQQINNGITNLYVGTLFMHPENPDTLLAGSSNVSYSQGVGIFLTTNGGETWEKVSPQGVQSVEFALSNPQIAYAGNPDAIYRSTDGGRTWQKVTPGDRRWGPPGVEAGFPIDFQVDPRNPNRLFANNYGGGNFLSEDGGQTWIAASKGYTGALVRGIAVAPDNPARVYAAARSGIFASSDGGENWLGLNYPPAGGLEWTVVAIDPANPQHVFAANTSFGSILESHDDGQTWRDTGAFVTGKGWRSLAFAPSDPNVIYAGTGAFFSGGAFDNTLPANGVHASINGGATWAAANDNTSQDAQVADIAVNTANPQLVYAATTNKGILVTSDGGANWQISNQALPQNPVVLSVAIHPTNPNVIFAGLEKAGLYRSVDGGANWQAIAAGLPAEATVTSIVFSPTDPDLMFLADIFSGVYRSGDQGGTWAPINDRLRTRATNVLALSSDGQHLYAATEGGGVFRLDLSGVAVGVEIFTATPTEFHLEQNYPNPFNLETTIRYNVPKTGHVQIKLYDVHGRVVRILVDESQSLGSHEVALEATGLASGLYFYQATMGGYGKTRKMILLK
jgi:photosystem II stability/assembly factor-like uncharacterized protein